MVLGLFEGERLLTEWRIATTRGRTADELDVQLAGLLARRGFDGEAVDAACLSTTVPTLSPAWEGALERAVGTPPVVVGPGIRYRHAGAHGQPARGRPGPGGERRGGLRPGRRAVRRGRLRHVDELRRRVGGRRLPGRGHRAGHRGVDGRPVRPRGAARRGGARGAAHRHRPLDHRVHPVRRGLRLRRAGGRHHAPHLRRARRPLPDHRHGRPRGPGDAARRDHRPARAGADPRRPAPDLERNREGTPAAAGASEGP